MFKCLVPTRLLALALLACVSAAQAFVVIPQGGGNYNKWGATSAAGTPGGVVTWGFIAAGTPGSAYCGDACPGTSSLSLPNFYADPAHSNSTTPLDLLTLQSTIQGAFDNWSAVADVQFQFVGVDASLKAINDPTAASPAIRVGAFAFGGGAAFSSAAVGFSPPPNGGTGSGDLLFNTNVGFQLASAAEGSALQLFPAGGGLFMNDINGLVLHEIGHTLGLLHSAVDTAVMCGGPTANCANLSTVTQQLKSDDIAGAQFLYGAAAPVYTTPSLRITSGQTARSAFQSSVISSGGPALVLRPRSLKRLTRSGEWSAFCTSALMRVTTAAGVPVGATRPAQT